MTSSVLLLMRCPAYYRAIARRGEKCVNYKPLVVDNYKLLVYG